MADVSKAIRARLLATTSLTDLVGQRVYRMFLPQNPTYEAVTVQQVSGIRTSVMGVDTGNVEGTVQVDTWGKPGGSTMSVKEEVRKSLTRFMGTADGTSIEDIYLESEIELWEDDSEALRVSQDYRVLWRE